MKENEAVGHASLLRTKLYAPPPRLDLVKRGRLLAELNTLLVGSAGFGRNLTLIAAPAGYGKTTLASQWLQTIDLPVAWLSLDPDDNDPTRFFRYLIAAFQTAAPDAIREPPSLAGAGPVSSIDTLTTEIINNLSAMPTPMMLVLDDYHVIESRAIHHQLTSVLEHQPANLHMVILTREDPLLPIP
jgi:LuxR family maltose regulon positive regulatory protein